MSYQDSLDLGEEPNWFWIKSNKDYNDDRFPGTPGNPNSARSTFRCWLFSNDRSQTTRIKPALLKTLTVVSFERNGWVKFTDSRPRHLEAPEWLVGPSNGTIIRSNGTKTTLQSISGKSGGAQVRSQNTGPEEDRTIPPHGPKPQHSSMLAGHAPAKPETRALPPFEHCFLVSNPCKPSCSPSREALRKSRLLPQSLRYRSTGR